MRRHSRCDHHLVDAFGYIVGHSRGEKIRQYLPVAKREGRKPLYDPIEVQKVIRSSPPENVADVIPPGLFP